MRKGTAGMDCDTYARRIFSLHDNETINNKTPEQKKNLKKMHVKNEKMNMTQVRKCQFSRLIYKGCDFSDGVVSLPIEHPCLEEVRNSKKESEKKIQNLFL